MNKLNERIKLMDTIKTNIYFFKQLYRFSPSLLIAQSLVALLDGITPLLAIIIPKLIIDELMYGKDFAKIIYYISVYAALQICITTIKSILTQKYINMGQHLYAMHFLLLINRKIAMLDLAQHDSPETHQMTALAQDIVYKGIGTNLVNSFFTLITSLVIVISTSIIIATVNPILIPIIVIFSLFSILINLKSENWKIKQRDENTYLTRVLNYYIKIMGEKSTVKEMKMYGFIDWLMEKYYATLSDLKSRLRKLYSYAMKISIIATTTELIKSNGIYLYLAWKAIIGHITIGEFTQYFNSTNQFSNSILSMINFFTQININGKYLISFQKFMELQSEMSGPTKDGQTLDSILGKDAMVLRLVNVSFKYPNSEKYVLKNVNCEFKLGKTYVIVGENGAGKTTLINLICRLYEPSSGTIYLNNTPINSIPDEEYKKLFSVVFQNFEHFAFSIAENVAPNNYNKASIEQIEKSLDDVGMLHKVQKMPKGIDTQLEKIFDQDGVILSGGEAQKLALARAIFRQSPIIILDEPSSALDPIAEDEILSNFTSVSKGKLVIFISHRMTSVATSDEIIFIKNNTIHEHGSHRDLIQIGSDYATYYDTQAKYYTSTVQESS